MTPFWWFWLVLPYVAAAVIYGRRWVQRRRRAAEARRRVQERAAHPTDCGGGIVFRPFSVFVNGTKLGLATSHDLKLTAEQTSLLVQLLVPSETRAEAQYLREAFVNGADCNVAIAPVDGETLLLGALRVTRLNYQTDYRTGVTKLLAWLEGPSLQRTVQATDGGSFLLSSDGQMFLRTSAGNTARVSS